MVMMSAKTVPNSNLQVFISYSHRDRAFIDRLASDLQVAGFGIWIDLLEVQVGESLSEEIFRGINQADCFFIVLSRDSVRSEWVKRELEIALAREQRDSRFFIIPILLHGSGAPASWPRPRAA